MRCYFYCRKVFPSSWTRSLVGGPAVDFSRWGDVPLKTCTTSHHHCDISHANHKQLLPERSWKFWASRCLPWHKEAWGGWGRISRVNHGFMHCKWTCIPTHLWTKIAGKLSTNITFRHLNSFNSLPSTSPWPHRALKKGINKFLFLAPVSHLFGFWLRVKNCGYWGKLIG